MQNAANFVAKWLIVQNGRKRIVRGFSSTTQSNKRNAAAAQNISARKYKQYIIIDCYI